MLQYEKNIFCRYFSVLMIQTVMRTWVTAISVPKVIKRPVVSLVNSSFGKRNPLGGFFMSEFKLYVGNLPFSTTEDSLRDLFSKSGNVESVRIVTDQATGRSKGFGFVEMSSEEEANTAVSNVNGMEVDGRKIKVDIAKPKEKRPYGGGGGGYGGGGGRKNFNR